MVAALPQILLAWGAHMNLQRITPGAWSFYLLKYQLKVRPWGSLRLVAARKPVV